MIHNGNQSNGNDPANSAAWTTASAMAGMSSVAARVSGELIGIFAVKGISHLVKLDILLFGHWRRRLAALYDRLGFKFLG